MVKLVRTDANYNCELSPDRVHMSDLHGREILFRSMEHPVGSIHSATSFINLNSVEGILLFMQIPKSIAL